MNINFGMNGTVTEEWAVLSSEAPTEIVYEVDFQIFVTERTLILEPKEGGTLVRWHEIGRIDNPMLRYMLLLMPAEDVIDNFDKALVALDTVSSAPKKQDGE